MPLSEKEKERYSRQIILEEIGFSGQTKLHESKVCLIGAGGLGSPIALQLVAMGIGSLRIIDRDIIEISNIHRQTLYNTDDIGYPKAEVAERKLKAVNPNLNIEALTISVNQDNVKEIVDGVDVVVDGLDSIETRYLVNRACVKVGIPYVYGAAIETIGSATTIIPGETPCVECFAPNLEEDQLPKCGAVGVHPSVISIIGSIQVTETVRILIGKKPNLAGRLVYFDVKNLTLDKIEIKKQKACLVCGEDKSVAPKQIPRRLIQDLCGRDQGKMTYTITPRDNLKLNIDSLSEKMRVRGFKIGVQGKKGVTFDYDNKFTVSILESGVAIVVGVNEEQDALRLYHEVVAKEMGIEHDRIDSEISALLAKPSAS
ncbi:ThiF family adenylyltransferase [Thermoproteota archaeon]